MIRDEEFTSELLLLTTTQAAKVLSISRTTVYALIKQGELRPVHISRACRISRAEIERYVARLELPLCEPVDLTVLATPVPTSR